MDQFAKKLPVEREPFFTEAAARRGILSLIVEKDFWVTWCLKRVFEMKDIPGHIFKGGTSLSKVYGLINRFSEDIDISIDRFGLGFAGERDPAQAGSRKKREKLTDDLKHTCANFIANESETCGGILVHIRSSQCRPSTLHSSGLPPAKSA